MLHACTHIPGCENKHTQKCMRTHTHTHTHTHRCMHITHTHTHTYTHTHVTIHMHKPVSKHTEYHSKGASPHNSLDSNKLCLLQTEGEPVPTTPLQNNSRRGAYSHDCPSRNRRGAYLHNCVDSSELCPLQSCRRWAYSHNCLNQQRVSSVPVAKSSVPFHITVVTAKSCAPLQSGSRMGAYSPDYHNSKELCHLQNNNRRGSYSLIVLTAKSCVPLHNSNRAGAYSHN